ncbi:hypothetical protein BC830DRAFT_1255020 [Chytriomyces sp. MP71]|nr:hypothetical protein BC830DRAFT_1255020 [Chytriomyces sp. MP71]
MAAAPALNCVVTLPPNALTAKGLSTPWTVTGCDQTANPTCTKLRFAECTVVDPATGALGVYSPLLVNQGAVAGKDFIAPVVPQLPANAVVGCWFGTNGATTALTDANNGADVKAANCIGIQGQTTFGQFAACNAQNFFATANTKAQIPPLGMGKNGQPCYTTRSFEVIDMDPSDNVVTTYSQAGKVLAQKTAANVAQLQKMAGTTPTDVTNGSDSLLLDGALRPASGCADVTAANLADPTGPQVGSLSLNELQANALQTKNPALVPPTDPFVLDANGTPNLAKQNMYRAAVNQPPATGTPAETMAFCQNMLSITAPSYITTSQFLLGQNTPDPANGIDLFTFMGQRFQASWAGLTCNTLIPLTDTNGTPVRSPVAPVIL